jgi:hypothetical protein
MKKTILILTAVTIGIGLQSATAQTDKKGDTPFTIISHEPVQMFFPDTIVTFSGEKIDSKILSPKGDLYYFAALTPAYPMEKVWTQLDRYDRKEDMAGKCFDFSIGLIPYCINLQALNDGDTVLIDSPEKFREIFAPVESVQEAIAFAYFFTESRPMYNFDFLEERDKRPQIDQERASFFEWEEKMIYYKKELEKYQIEKENYEKIMKKWKPNQGVPAPTPPIMPMSPGMPMPPTPPRIWNIYQPIINSSYAKEVDDGYELLLYHYEVFGCSHPYWERLIKVYFDGKVEIMRTQVAFENKMEIGLCVD